MEDVGKLLRIVTKVQKQIRESIPLEIEEKLNKKKNKMNFLNKMTFTDKYTPFSSLG